jgi:hypothetical protein
LLKDFDERNIQVFGRIPSEEEFIPIVEINIKLPGEVQTILKSINQQSEIVNKKLVEG